MRSAAGVVHITDPDALVELPGRQLLATVYDLIPLKEGVDKRGPLARLGYKRYLRALPAANMLFAISQQTADDLVQELHVSKERIVIARPGIDIAPASESVAAPDRAYFVFVGGPNPNKNLEVVLEAMKLCPDLPEELLIIGHWLPRQLSALAGRLESDGLTQRVRHLGYVPDADLTRLMRDSTAVVVPSLMEGFGLAVGEGMAAGAAIIHSRLAVLEETSGGTALTFDPQSPAELADRLRTVSRDPTVRDHSRRLGLLRASELTWDSAVENTLATYRAFLRR